jgi:hypothetical protein
MQSTSIEKRDLMEHLAIVTARQQRDQYLEQLDQLLESLGDAAPGPLEDLEGENRGHIFNFQSVPSCRFAD